MKKQAPVKEGPSSAHGGAIRPCTCQSAYQDATYGNKMRVHTRGGAKDRPTFCCTVCGKKQ